MKKIFTKDTWTGILCFLVIFLWGILTIIISGRIVEKQVEQRLAEYGIETEVINDEVG